MPDPKKDKAPMWRACDDEPLEAQELDEMVYTPVVSKRILKAALVISLVMMTIYTVLAIKIFGKP